jgi:hypothetical protein
LYHRKSNMKIQERDISSAPLELVFEALQSELARSQELGAAHLLAGEFDLASQCVERARTLSDIRMRLKSLMKELASVGVGIHIGTSADEKSDASSETSASEPNAPEAVEESADGTTVKEDAAPPIAVAEVVPAIQAEPVAQTSEEALRLDPPKITRQNGKRGAPPKPADNRAPLRERIKDYFALSGEVLDGGDFDGVRLCRLKAAVCSGRAILCESKLGAEDSAIWDEIEQLKALYDRHSDAPFFGFKRHRSPSQQAWEEAAEAYRAMAQAEQCVNVLISHATTLDPATFEALLFAGSAAETLVHRVLIEHNLQNFDRRQTELHDRYKQIGASCNHFVPYWKADGSVTLGDLRRAASPLAKLLHDAITGPAKVNRKRQALASIQKLIAAPFDFGDFEDELVARAIECMEAGVAPTKKELTEALMPFRGLIEESQDARLKRLTEATKNAASLAARKQTANVQEPAVDEETESRIRDLRELLEGKIALFVGGGNKGNRGRADAVREALGLSEVIWPDAEPGTHVKRFDADVERADLVCKVVKEARTGYGKLVKDAQAKGKMGAYILRGVGVNMVVYDLHRQLVRR